MIIFDIDIVGEDSEQTKLSQIAIQSELPSSNNGTYRPPTLQETGVDILNFKPGKDNFGKLLFFFSRKAIKGWSIEILEGSTSKAYSSGF